MHGYLPYAHLLTLVVQFLIFLLFFTFALYQQSTAVRIPKAVTMDNVFLCMEMKPVSAAKDIRNIETGHVLVCIEHLNIFKHTFNNMLRIHLN